jgi:outer membrane protein assembly factor BamB
MPADLEEMFAALSRDADAVPLSEAPAARRRGEQRTRNHAVTAAALSVCLVAVGLGAVSWAAHRGPDHRRTGPPAVEPFPGTLPKLGPAIPFGADAGAIAMTAIAGARAFAEWSDDEGSIRVLATDLGTGRELWRSGALGSVNDVSRIIALPQWLVVVAGRGNEAARTVFVLDPVTGAIRWQAPFDLPDDSSLFYPDVLVTVSDGVITAVSWSTGDTVWRSDLGTGRPAQIAGLPTAADAARGMVTDPRLVQINDDGTVIVRAAATGRRLPPDVPPRVNANGRQYASGGRLFTVSEAEPYRIQRTDLTTGAQSTWTGPAGRTFAGLAPCGGDRVCVTDTVSGGSSQLALVDVGGRRQRWRNSGGSEVLAARGDRVMDVVHAPMTVYDIDSGRPVVTGGRLRWLDDRTMLSLPAGGPATGPVARVSTVDGRRQELGTITMPPQSLCSATTTRLVCTGPTALQVYDIH